VVEIDIVYEGELRCDAKHAPSKTELSTDAPVDNMGKGGSFSPTDLLATSLGTCMATTMGIAARRNGWDIDGISLRVQKEMTKEPPRRVARLGVQFTIPERVKNALGADAKQALEQVARTCPVALSLSQSVEIDLQLPW
jgi:putative redox protein